MITIYIVVYCVQLESYGEPVFSKAIMAFKNRDQAVQYAQDKNAFLINFDEWYEVQELYLKES